MSRYPKGCTADSTDMLRHFLDIKREVHKQQYRSQKHVVRSNRAILLIKLVAESCAARAITDTSAIQKADGER